MNLISGTHNYVKEEYIFMGLKKYSIITLLNVGPVYIFKTSFFFSFSFFHLKWKGGKKFFLLSVGALLLTVGEPFLHYSGGRGGHGFRFPL